MPDEEQVFVDTSIWIDFFKDAENPNAFSLKKLLDEDRAIISHIVLAEILPFIRHKREQKEIDSYLRQLDILPFEVDDWEEMISLRCQLYRKGITGTSIPDLIIASLCLKHNVPVFSDDKHFRLFANAIPLRIFGD